MREICTSGSVGGEGGDILAYPALRPTKPAGRRRPCPPLAGTASSRLRGSSALAHPYGLL